MTTTEASSDGSRRVGLYLPFEWMGKRIDAIVFRAVELEDTLAWEAGEIAGPMDMMSRLTGLDQTTLGKVKYPDADRLMAEFMGHLPPSVRTALATGSVPMRNAHERPVETYEEPGYTEEQQEALNIGGEPELPEPPPPGPNFPYPEQDRLKDVPGASMGLDLSDGGQRDRSKT